MSTLTTVVAAVVFANLAIGLIVTYVLQPRLTMIALLVLASALIWPGTLASAWWTRRVAAQSIPLLVVDDDPDMDDDPDLGLTVDDEREQWNDSADPADHAGRYRL